MKKTKKVNENKPLTIRGVIIIRGVRGWDWLDFFSKFITEPIKIGFLIIETDTYRLGSVFYL